MAHDFSDVFGSYKKCVSCGTMSDDGGFSHDGWHCLDCCEKDSIKQDH